MASAIILVCAASYSPVFQAGFIFDDDVMLTNNPLIKASSGLLDMWTSRAVDFWPITGASFWIEWRLWGTQASGYHVTNVLLHAGCALLLWRLLRRLRIPGALLAALLFAVHPVAVQSVAWIAERKNTLSLLFCLLAFDFFLSSTRPMVGRSPDPLLPSAELVGLTWRSDRERWYWLSLVAFVLAMLSKGSVAMFPVVLLLFIWWRSGRLRAQDLLRTTPFFVVGAGLTAVNVWFQARNAGGIIRDVGALDRLLGAPAVVWFYLWKALVPLKLVFIYPQWQVAYTDWRWWLPMATALLVTASLWLIRRYRAPRALLFVWAASWAVLVPVLGLTDVQFMRFSLVSDHYQYAALAVIASAAAAGISRLSPAWSRITGAVLVSVFAVLTWRQATLYVDAKILYERTTEDNPDAWLAHNNLAMLLLHAPEPKVPAAIAHMRAAVALEPQNPMLHHNLGEALFKHGEFEAALAEHREGVARSIDHLRTDAASKPNDPLAQNALGTALFEGGDFAAALVAHQAAVRLAPDYAPAYVGLGDDLLRLGRSQEAIAAYERALQIDPALPSVRTNLGLALNAVGKGGAAAEHLERAVADAVASADPLAEADSLLQLGKAALAVERYRQVLAERPSSVHALNNLGYALTLLGQLDEAESRLRQVLLLQPGHAGAHDNLGNVLRQRGALGPAVQEFRLALQHGTGMELARIHNDLGIALAQSGNLVAAIEEFRAALKVDPTFKAAQANLARAQREAPSH